MAVLSEKLGNVVATLPFAPRAFDAQHRELASDITECKICAGHFCSLSTTRQGGEAAQA
jgi:hypothetical protein